jgi:hypothetical protein
LDRVPAAPEPRALTEALQVLEAMLATAARAAGLAARAGAADPVAAPEHREVAAIRSLEAGKRR